MIYLTDEYLFPAIEVGLALLCLWAFVTERLVFRRSSEAMASVDRGDKSMALFYGAYGVMSAVLVAIALQVRCAEDYRTIAVLFNSVAPAYLCVINGWSRNRLLGCIVAFSKREHL